MGCYNIVCAITQLNITCNDPCVVIPLMRNSKIGDISTSDDVFIINGFPIRGTYDDYGGMDYIDDKGTNRNINVTDGEIMMVHAAAYDFILAEHLAQKQKETASAKTNGYTDWHQKFINEILEALDEVTNPTGLEKKLDDLLETDRTGWRKESFMHKFAKLVAAYGMTSGDWESTIFGSDDPKATVQRYLDECFPIALGRSTFCYRIWPSLYGTQDFPKQAYLRFAELRKTICETVTEGWED